MCIPQSRMTFGKRDEFSLIDSPVASLVLVGIFVPPRKSERVTMAIMEIINKSRPPRLTRSQHQAGGFTLASTLVAMALLGIMTIAALTTISHAVFNVRMAQENDRATQILIEKTESIRLYNWDQISSNGFIPTNFTIAYDPESTNLGTLYNGTMAIDSASTGTSYSNDLKSITVRISWQTGALQRRRELTTYVSRYGLEDYVY